MLKQLSYARMNNKFVVCSILTFVWIVEINGIETSVDVV